MFTKRPQIIGTFGLESKEQGHLRSSKNHNARSRGQHGFRSPPPPRKHVIVVSVEEMNDDKGLTGGGCCAGFLVAPHNRELYESRETTDQKQAYRMCRFDFVTPRASPWRRQPRLTCVPPSTSSAAERTNLPPGGRDGER